MFLLPKEHMRSSLVNFWRCESEVGLLICILCLRPPIFHSMFAYLQTFPKSVKRKIPWHKKTPQTQAGYISVTQHHGGQTQIRTWLSGGKAVAAQQQYLFLVALELKSQYIDWQSRLECRNLQRMGGTFCLSGWHLVQS